MVMTPQLRKLIDDINNKDIVEINYTYKDGGQVILKTDEKKIIIVTNNINLKRTLSKLLQKVLQGDVKGAIDKN
jgi:FKBP-type peptidyl-prolyl cis-trans isomerase 2